MMKLLKTVSYKPDMNFKSNFFIKDFALDKVLRFRPELNDVIIELQSQMPRKQFLTIDYSELILNDRDKTCKDIGWHVDGKDNHYILVCWGDLRTTFFQSSDSKIADAINTLGIITGSDFRQYNHTINSLISHIAVDSDLMTPDSGMPVLYDSSIIHKGHKSVGCNKRVFLRLCMSDYINPKNKIIIKEKK